MKIIVVVSILFLFQAGCSGNFSSYDQEYYERVSGMTIPGNYQLLETVDNGEFVTISVFRADSSDLAIFIRKYGLQPLKVGVCKMMGMLYLKNNKVEAEPGKKFFSIGRSKDKNSWTYLVDLSSRRLWAEITYPDFGGN